MNQSYSVLITGNIDSHNFNTTDLIIINGKVNQNLDDNKISIEVFSPTGKSSLHRIVEIYPNGDFSIDFYANYTHGRFDPDISGTYDVLGTILTDNGPVTMTITNFELVVEPKINEIINKENGGCLIVTATFGSELAPQVQQLRELRDNIILSTQSGTAFMTGFNQLYYSFSPTIADLEREYPMFKEIVKLSITPMLSTLSILNYADIDSEQEMLSYGIGVILLNLGMYFVAPIIIIFQLKSKLKNSLR